VGLTRARDYLVFPTTVNATKWLNRVFNHGDESIPTLDPDSDETPFYHDGRPLVCQTEVIYQPKDFPESLPDESPVLFHAPRAGKHPVPRQSLLIDPTQDPPPGFDPQFGEPVAWGSWLEFSGDYTSALGKAIQTFFIADHPNADIAQRVATAKKQLEIRNAGEAVAPEALARQSVAFRDFVEKRFQPRAALGKYPLEGWHGQRLLRLEADLLLENENSLTLLMLAPFAEGMKKWRPQAQNQAQTLGWCRVLLRQTPVAKELRFWVVFPVEGQAVEVRF